MRRGVLLIELLLSLVLLGVAAVSLVSLLSVLMAAGATTSNQTQALRLCQERMEQVTSIIGLSEGTGSNPDTGFLPAMDNEQYGNTYLTESDYYQANYGTAGSLSALSPPRRVDRITRIEWVDDAYGGTTQDYFLVTVSVIWEEAGRRRIVSIKRYLLK